MKSIFPHRRRAINPSVVVRVPRAGGYAYTEDTLRGKYWHVVPKCAREICALQLMDHRVDKFAPAKGDGVIVTGEALARLDA